MRKLMLVALIALAMTLLAPAAAQIAPAKARATSITAHVLNNTGGDCNWGQCQGIEYASWTGYSNTINTEGMHYPDFNFWNLFMVIPYIHASYYWQFWARQPTIPTGCYYFSPITRVLIAQAGRNYWIGRMRAQTKGCQ